MNNAIVDRMIVGRFAAKGARIEELEMALRAMLREHLEPHGPVPTDEERALIRAFAKEFGIDGG